MNARIVVRLFTCLNTAVLQEKVVNPCGSGYAVLKLRFTVQICYEDG